MSLVTRQQVAHVLLASSFLWEIFIDVQDYYAPCHAWNIWSTWEERGLLFALLLLAYRSHGHVLRLLVFQPILGSNRRMELALIGFLATLLRMSFDALLIGLLGWLMSLESIVVTRVTSSEMRWALK